MSIEFPDNVDMKILAIDEINARSKTIQKTE